MGILVEISHLPDSMELFLYYFRSFTNNCVVNLFIGSFTWLFKYQNTRLYGIIISVLPTILFLCDYRN